MTGPTDPTESTDRTKPLMLGYIRAHIFMEESEVKELKVRLADLAETEGYTLGHVFVERPERAPAAYFALIEEVHRVHAQAIVVPHMKHLAVVGVPVVIKQHLQHLTGVPVFTADDPPP